MDKYIGVIFRTKNYIILSLAFIIRLTVNTNFDPKYYFIVVSYYYKVLIVTLIVFLILSLLLVEI